MKRNGTEIKLVDLPAEPVNTWSATRPAYAFTVLCPERRYRLGGELYGLEIKRRDKAVGAVGRKRTKKRILEILQKNKDQGKADS